MSLNEAAYELVRPLLERPGLHGTACHRRGGAWVVDCGVEAPGGIDAGLLVAAASLGGRGEVAVEPGDLTGAGRGDAGSDPRWPTVTVASAAPVAACLAAQYAGWKVATGDYFAMASGPIRAAIGREDPLRARWVSASAQRLWSGCSRRHDCLRRTSASGW